MYRRIKCASHFNLLSFFNYQMRVNTTKFIAFTLNIEHTLMAYYFFSTASQHQIQQ